MLQSYYDLAKKESFGQLFGSLYIGSHPTQERNSYVILSLNLSFVSGTLGEYRESMDKVLREDFIAFCSKYSSLLPENAIEEVEKRKGAIVQLKYICAICQRAGLRIYLLIDEYDHFTNDILSNPERLNDYEGETHGEGYLRQFFNAIKGNTNAAIKRCFITGVSPVTMDDLTSGFNIATNYSTSSKFNAMIGFTEQEVRTMLDYYASATGVFKHSTDDLIQIMAPYYDHYCFSN
jgi:hypothetical protein